MAIHFNCIVFCCQLPLDLNPDLVRWLAKVSLAGIAFAHSPLIDSSLDMGDWLSAARLILKNLPKSRHQ